MKFLDFEQPIAELEAKIEELRLVGTDSEINISEEIDRLESKSKDLMRSIFKKLTVEQNVFVLWELTGKIPKDQYEARLVALLSDMGLMHLRYAKGIELSGGEKRRVEIVRALAMDPAFIFLDEPFAGIDPILVIVIVYANT